MTDQEDLNKAVRAIEIAAIQFHMKNSNLSQSAALRHVLVEQNLATKDEQTGAITLADDSVVEALLIKKQVLRPVDTAGDGTTDPVLIKSMRMQAGTAYLNGKPQTFLRDSFEENKVDFNIGTQEQIIGLLKLGNAFARKKGADMSRQNTMSRRR